MKTEHIFLGIAFVMTMASCTHSDNLYDNFKVVNSLRGGEPVQVRIEPVKLDSIQCSGESFSGVTPSGNIYYLDRYSGHLYEFSKEGSLVSRKLGFGRGPEETLIKKCRYCTNSSSGEYALSGNSLDFELFSEGGKKENSFRISYGDGTTEPDSFRTYSNAWSNIVCRLNDGLFYQGKMSENPSFNYFDNTSTYLAESRHVSVVNMNTGEIVDMRVKGYPSIYEKNPYKYSSFQCVNFDVNNKGDFYVNFEADSLIYVFDKEMKPKRAFGASGKNMDMDYKPVSAWEQMPIYQENRETKGCYATVEFIDETGLCFRSYKKGASSEFDGLQVYDKDGRLISDSEVPKGFKIVGYIAPDYYSQVYDNEDGSLVIYKFKL